MSTDYRTVLLDDMDWAYVGRSRLMTIVALRTHGFDVVDTPGLYGWIIIESRWHPEATLIDMHRAGVLVFDAAYIQEGTRSELTPIAQP